MSSTVFDDEIFFSGYMAIRSKEDNYNDLVEQPAMRRLLPDLKGKRILDLGCGTGRNLTEFAEAGASEIIGIDVSEKMLSLAEENCRSFDNIRLLKLGMEDISALSGPFDLVYSSLAFHYAEDFEKLCRDICFLLSDGGTLLFSQEHPLTTADGNGHYNYDESGTALSYTFSSYMDSGRRYVHWMVDGVRKNHRPFSKILSALITAGFMIEAVEEPIASGEVMEKYPRFRKDYIKPSFLIIKCRKLSP